MTSIKTVCVYRSVSIYVPVICPRNVKLLFSCKSEFMAAVGKYGLRIFDVYQPNEASVFKNYFLWRNANSGWTGTVIGKVGFDGFVAAENGMNIFESRATTLSSWDECFIKNSLFIDHTGFHLGYSLTANDMFDFNLSTVMGGPCCEQGGILLPWNDVAGGGMLIANCTWVNFKNPCIRCPLLLVPSL